MYEIVRHDDVVTLLREPGTNVVINRSQDKIEVPLFFSCRLFIT